MAVIQICCITLPRMHFNNQCRYRVCLYCVYLLQVYPESRTKTFHSSTSIALVFTCLLISSSHSTISRCISSLVPPTYATIASWISLATGFLPQRFLVLLGLASALLSCSLLPFPFPFTARAIVVLSGGLLAYY